MKFIQKFMTGLLITMMCAGSAMAQDNAADDSAAKKEHNGGSFTIIPPEGWILVSGNLGEKEVNKLPENVREHYTLRNTDVIFMNLSSQDANDKGFKDSLNIVTINEPIPLTEDLVKEISGVLKQQYQSMFNNTFEFDGEPSISKINDKDVLLVKGQYTVSSYSVKLEQVLVPSQKESLVLTCTYDSKKSDAAAIIAACQESVKSLKFTD